MLDFSMFVCAVLCVANESILHARYWRIRSVRSWQMRKTAPPWHSYPKRKSRTLRAQAQHTLNSCQDQKNRHQESERSEPRYLSIFMATGSFSLYDHTLDWWGWIRVPAKQSNDDGDDRKQFLQACAVWYCFFHIEPEGNASRSSQGWFGGIDLDWYTLSWNCHFQTLSHALQEHEETWDTEFKDAFARHKARTVKPQAQKILDLKKKRAAILDKLLDNNDGLLACHHHICTQTMLKQKMLISSHYYRD